MDPPVAVGAPLVPMVVADLVATPVVGIITPAVIAAALSMTPLIPDAVSILPDTPQRGTSILVNPPVVSVPTLLVRPVKR